MYFGNVAVAAFDGKIFKSKIKMFPDAHEQSDRFQPGEILKIIKYTGYSIRYYKIFLQIYLGSSSFSNAGRCLRHTQYK